MKKTQFISADAQHASTFDDYIEYQSQTQKFPTKITLISGQAIEQIGLCYGDTCLPRHGRNPSAKEYSFELLKDEHIIKITGLKAYYWGNNFLFSLKFHTDKGRTLGIDNDFQDLKKIAKPFTISFEKGYALTCILGETACPVDFPNIVLNRTFLSGIGAYQARIDGKIEYNIEIKTADEYLAGTNSNIFIILHGEKGQTVEERLNGHISHNAFERNQIDSLSLPLDDVGEIYKIDLRSDYMYPGAGWRVSYVKVTREDSSRSSMFYINQWIEDTDTRTFQMSIDDWSQNQAVFKTEIIEYKKYPISVPSNSQYEYSQTEKITTGFTYNNDITRKTTANFNKEIQVKPDFSLLSKLVSKLEKTNVAKGYLKFAFNQGFENTNFSEIVKTENKELTETVKQTITNNSEHEKTYYAIFNITKVSAIVTLNDRISAEFSLNAKIQFGGITEKK